ncbi:MAG: hypothetical protein QW292_10400 [Candidatus Parvarchaeota archaeon]
MHGDQRKNWYTVARSCTESKFFNVTFTGKRATIKGSTLNSSNPLDALALFLSTLDILDSHLSSDTLIQKRLLLILPTAINVLPLISSLNIQIRIGDEDYLERVIVKVKESTKGIAIATGSSVLIVDGTHNYQRIIQNMMLENLAKKIIVENGHKFTQDQ